MNLHLKISYLNWKFTLTLDKIPWDSAAIFIFFCHFSVPSYKSASFSKFSCSSPSPTPPPTPTLYKVENGKKFWIHTSSIVCGVRGGVGPVWIGKQKRKSVPRLFVYDCSHEQPGPWQNREEAVSNFFKGRVTIKVKFDDWRTTIQ